MTPLCFIDTETTALHRDRRAWEIAMHRREPSGDTATWIIQIADVDLSDADPASLKISRFYERHAIYADLSEAGAGAIVMMERRTAALVERVTRGAHLVGAIPSFDADTLAPMLRRHQLLPAWHHRLICVESLTSGHLGRYVGGLARCAEALGIPVDENAAHTALGDTTTAMRIYDRIITGQHEEAAA